MKVDGDKRRIVIGNSEHGLRLKKNCLRNSMAGDAIKYNLRCNRNISEKMTKKDFVYDIRPPNQSIRKFEEGKYPVVLPLQLRRKQSSDSRAPQYTVILEKNDHGAGGDAMNGSG
ncbi:uncharacterized protein LOC143358697 [Halictus rubicundus]|uniref:uncharacterized protein LOC143358697 n=1 Tax=Halictus rubicundus TaxID=77578 RepID=UPI00403510E6